MQNSSNLVRPHWVDIYMDANALGCLLWSYLQLVDVFYEALSLHVHLSFLSADVGPHSTSRCSYHDLEVEIQAAHVGVRSYL